MTIALAVLLLSGTSAAQDEPREVLCLWDSTERAEPRFCEIHVYGEVVLNYLGLLAVYRDVNDPLPGDGEMKRYRGVFTWFADRKMKNSRAYWKWLARQAEAGRRIVILGELGATTDIPAEFVNEGLRPLGLTYYGGDGGDTDDASVIEVVRRGPMLDFERTLEGDFRSFIHVRADPSNRVHLRVRRRDRPGVESDLVVTGPRGGFAWTTVHFDPFMDRDQWHMNPFEFLEEALGVEGMPRPDLTTSHGRRIYFCSIDGDGLGNRVQPGPKTGRLAGEVARDDFIKAFDLPFTASVIAADLADHAGLAKSIFELPNVEVGCHAYYHPLSWSGRKLAYPGEFSLEREIDEAVKRVAEVAGRPVRIYLWTGDCDPPPEAIDRVDRLGIANLNGWDPGRFQNYDALTNLRSATAPREGRVQFNARSMSENHFTDLWTRNFFAYRNVIITYVRSGTPRRITPIHVYFHFYLVEQPGGEAALREVLTWAASQEIHPMTASEYVAWVRGFASARLERKGAGRWRISGYGACRTVRLDRVAEVPDLAACSNILGFRRDGEALYVHLGPGEEAILAMGTQPQAGPYLIEANGEWRDGKIHSKTAARAAFMTPEGVRSLSGSGHVLDAEIR